MAGVPAAPLPWEFNGGNGAPPHYGRPPSDPRRMVVQEEQDQGAVGPYLPGGQELLPQHALVDHAADEFQPPISTSGLQPLPPSSDWSKLQQCVSELRVSLSQARAITVDLNQQVAGLTESLQDKHAENSYLQYQYSQVTQELQLALSQLQGQHEDTQAHVINQLRADLAASAQQCVRLEADVQQLQFELHSCSASATAALAAERDERERAAGELGAVRLLLAARQRHIDALQSQLSEEKACHESEVADLRSELDRARQQVAEVQHEAEQYMQRLHEAHEAGVQLAQHVQELEQVQEQHVKETAAYKHRVTELEVQREWLEGAVTDLQQGNTSATTFVQLKEAVRGSREQYATAQREVAQLKATITQLEAQLQQQQGGEADGEQQQALQQWQARCVELESQLQSLQLHELPALQQQAQLVQARADQAEAQLQAMQAHVQCGAEEQTASQELHQSLQLRAEQAEAQLQQVLAEIDRLKSEQGSAAVTQPGGAGQGAQAGGTGQVVQQHTDTGTAGKADWSQLLFHSDDDEEGDASGEVDSPSKVSQVQHPDAPTEPATQQITITIPETVAAAQVDSQAGSQDTASPGKQEPVQPSSATPQPQVACVDAAVQTNASSSDMVCIEDVRAALEEARQLSKLKLEQALASSGAMWGQRVQEVTDELQATQQQVAVAEGKAVDLKQQLGSAQAQVKSLTDRISAADQELSRVREELLASRAQVADLEAQHRAALQQVAMESDAELAAALLDVNSVVQTHSLSSLQQTRHLKQQLLATQAEVVDLQQQVVELQAQVQHYQQQEAGGGQLAGLMQRTYDARMLEEEVEELRQQVARLQEAAEQEVLAAAKQTLQSQSHTQTAVHEVDSHGDLIKPAQQHVYGSGARSVRDVGVQASAEVRDTGVQACPETAQAAIQMEPSHVGHMAVQVDISSSSSTNAAVVHQPVDVGSPPTGVSGTLHSTGAVTAADDHHHDPQQQPQVAVPAAGVGSSLVRGWSKDGASLREQAQAQQRHQTARQLQQLEGLRASLKAGLYSHGSTGAVSSIPSQSLPRPELLVKPLAPVAKGVQQDVLRAAKPPRALHDITNKVLIEPAAAAIEVVLSQSAAASQNHDLTRQQVASKFGVLGHDSYTTTGSNLNPDVLPVTGPGGAYHDLPTSHVAAAINHVETHACIDALGVQPVGHHKPRSASKSNHSGHDTTAGVQGTSLQQLGRQQQATQQHHAQPPVHHHEGSGGAQQAGHSGAWAGDGWLQPEQEPAGPHAVHKRRHSIDSWIDAGQQEVLGSPKASFRGSADAVSVPQLYAHTALQQHQRHMLQHRVGDDHDVGLQQQWQMPAGGNHNSGVQRKGRNCVPVTAGLQGDGYGSRGGVVNMTSAGAWARHVSSQAAHGKQPSDVVAGGTGQQQASTQKLMDLFDDMMQTLSLSHIHKERSHAQEAAARKLCDSSAGLPVGVRGTAHAAAAESVGSHEGELLSQGHRSKGLGAVQETAVPRVGSYQQPVHEHHNTWEHNGRMQSVPVVGSSGSGVRHTGRHVPDTKHDRKRASRATVPSMTSGAGTGGEHPGLRQGWDRARGVGLSQETHVVSLSSLRLSGSLPVVANDRYQP